MKQKAVVIWGEHGTWLQTIGRDGNRQLSDMGRMQHSEALWFAYGHAIDFSDASGLHRFSEGRRVVGSPVKAVRG